MGVSQRLVEAVEHGLRKLGAERINSLVFREEKTVAFWKTMGYNPDPATERYAEDLKRSKEVHSQA